MRRGGRLVLPGVSLEVAAGTVTGLLGPSGSGKTTLMRAIVGVQIVEAGTVRVLGLPAGSPGAAAARRLRDAGALGLRRPDACARTCATSRGSSGRRRRGSTRRSTTVDLARAGRPARRARSPAASARASRSRRRCSVEPELLVLDEPTVGLDPVLRRDLWKHFRGSPQTAATLLVSSHVMDEAERCDELLLMRDGRVLATGSPPDDLLRAHRRREPRGGVPRRWRRAR